MRTQPHPDYRHATAGMNLLTLFGPRPAQRLAPDAAADGARRPHGGQRPVAGGQDLRPLRHVAGGRNTEIASILSETWRTRTACTSRLTPFHRRACLASNTRVPWWACLEIGNTVSQPPGFLPKAGQLGQSKRLASRPRNSGGPVTDRRWLGVYLTHRYLAPDRSGDSSKVLGCRGTAVSL